MIKRALDMLNPLVRFRSAITGQWVTRIYALAHPDTTVAERYRP